MTSKVIWAFSAPIGSLEMAARCMTQSQPSRSRGLDLADVLDELPVGLDHGLPVAALEETEVATDDGVAFLLQQVDQVSPDVASMAGDKDFHGVLLAPGCGSVGKRAGQTAQGAWPEAQSLFRYSRSRWVSMQAQKPRCLNMLSWPSRARRISGSRSRTQFSSGER